MSAPLISREIRLEQEIADLKAKNKGLREVLLSICHEKQILAAGLADLDYKLKKAQLAYLRLQNEYAGAPL